MGTLPTEPLPSVRARDGLAARVSALMPGLVEDLKALVAVPSVSGPGVPAEPLSEAHDMVVALLEDAGVHYLADLRIEGRSPRWWWPSRAVPRSG